MGLLIVTWLLFLIPHLSGHVAQQAPAAVVTFLEFLITRVFLFGGLVCEYTVSFAVPVPGMASLAASLPAAAKTSLVRTSP